MKPNRPEFKTIEVVLTEPFEGWRAKMRVGGVPARVMIDLQSGEVERALTAVDRLIIEHNFLDENGEPAKSVLDAPMDALTQSIEKWSGAVSSLPPA